VKHARKRAAAATVGFAVCGVVVAVAVASPPFKFSATNLVAEAEMPNPVHVNSDRVKFRTKDPVDVRVQEINIEPGGRSGWHHHPGVVIVAVKEGTVTFVDVWTGLAQRLGVHRGRRRARRGPQHVDRSAGQGVRNICRA